MFTNPCGRCPLFVLGVSTVGSAPTQLPERQLQHSHAAGREAEALETNLPKSPALRSLGCTVLGTVGTGWVL